MQAFILYIDIEFFRKQKVKLMKQLAQVSENQMELDTVFKGEEWKIKSDIIISKIYV